MTEKIKVGDKVRVVRDTHLKYGDVTTVLGIVTSEGGPYAVCDGIPGGIWIEWLERVEQHDPVNHPPHYTSDPSGVECIQVTRHRNFNVGNAMKYLWRAGLKKDAGRDAREKEIEDLRKAVWYLNDEIGRLGADV